ncbi:diguanylate cyclase [Cupriavidus basilensis]|uniref:Diguanylate cyclase n=1 Tax=Cupriavidus basilensis TaxID=68895 RepID=A0ABT6AIA6_9BURK|nr:diguanylate cyclase [Cupriavidus basilensis]MDF3832337.1 diguanylate cyclase [Cupriavidus basilensis]
MAQESLHLALIGPAPTHAAHVRADRFDSVGDLLTDARRYDVVLLDLPGSAAGEALREMRRHPAYGFTLAYCCQDEDPLCEALGDGPVPADLGLLEWQTWRTRYAALGEAQIQERFETRVLAWLWLRPPRQLRAVRNPQVPEHYEYPLLAALAGADAGSPLPLLQLMTQEGYIAEQVLVDRLRLCVSCGSGRLNYIDVCPDCQSIAISREPSLHCFVCGHVGAQEQFLKDGVLVCPNCLTRLRHIGSDYDRPMENYRCRSCRAFFVDAKVQARCLDCGHTHAPDELRVYEVRNYRLTEAGHLRCRQGFNTGMLASAGFNALGLVSISTFRYLLEWLMQMQARYKEPAFSLLGLRFVNFPQALAKMGEQRANLLVDNLVKRMIAGLRTTDRCTRTNDECLWLLLPCTDKEGLESVRQRILKLRELFAESGANEIELRVVSASAPDDLLEREDAELLMARLAGDLS